MKQHLEQLLIRVCVFLGLLRKNNARRRSVYFGVGTATDGKKPLSRLFSWGSSVPLYAGVTVGVFLCVVGVAWAATGQTREPTEPVLTQETPAPDELQSNLAENELQDEPDPVFDWESGDDPVYQPTPDETPPLEDDPYAKLSPGETHARVAELQERLMTLDYMENDEPTEFYGFVTKYSIQLFQREHGLLVDGIAGPDTLKLLYSDDAKPYVVRKGDRGTDVLELQKRLRELNYLKERANGTFGDATLAAVLEFQKRNKLTDDGVIGSRTREALYSEKAKPAPTPRPTPSPTPKPGTTPKKSALPTPKVAVAKTPRPDTTGVDKLLDIAEGLKGRKYVFGAKGPSTFDCSGFVYYCLKEAGASVRYMTSEGWRSSSYKTIGSMSDLKKGDILCFDGHVGIYMGSGRMIDASSSNGKVRVTNDIRENSYWTRHFIFAKRVY